MYNDTEIGQLIKDGNHEAAAEKLFEMLRANGGNVTHASIRANVHRATMKRWLERLELAGIAVTERIVEIRNEAEPSRQLSEQERQEAAKEIREKRERARAIAWLSTADSYSLERVARWSRSPLAVVAKVASFKRVPTDVQERVIRAAGRALEEQRALWRRDKAERLKRNQGMVSTG